MVRDMGLVMSDLDSGLRIQVEILGLVVIFGLGWRKEKCYSLRPTFFVLFKKSIFLREHHLLSCLHFKNVEVSKTILKKIYQKIELVN